MILTNVRMRIKSGDSDSGKFHAAARLSGERRNFIHPQRTANMPFIDIKNWPSLEVLPGCRLRTPYGENLMLSYLEMDEGAVIPLHHHPHEQGGMLLEGRLEFTLGAETRTVESGAMFLIPPDVPHKVVALEPSIVLDVFAPVREDYAEMYNKYIPDRGSDETT
jgi:quercetin dioxygenase-like cupin family protein